MTVTLLRRLVEHRRDKLENHSYQRQRSETVNCRLDDIIRVTDRYRYVRHLKYTSAFALNVPPVHRPDAPRRHWTGDVSVRRTSWW